MIFIGIDGGGTSCRARIRNEQGQILGEGKSGSANVMLGIDVAFDSISQAIDIANKSANIDLKDAHLGLALAGAEDTLLANKLLERDFGCASVVIDTDALGACLGAFTGEDGAIQIVGTGACGLVLLDGKASYVGGNEFPISDQGSGAMLGLDLLQKTLLAVDDVIPASQITQKVMADFDNDVSKVVRWSKTAKPFMYGQWAKDIFEFAEQGDVNAKAVLEKGIADVELFLRTLIKKGAPKIAMMGSIGERLAPDYADDIQPYLAQPEMDAIDGAIVMVRQSLKLPNWF